MDLSTLIPAVPSLFVDLSQRFGLLLAVGFAIMTMAPFERSKMVLGFLSAISLVLCLLSGCLCVWRGDFRNCWENSPFANSC